MQAAYLFGPGDLRVVERDLPPLRPQDGVTWGVDRALRWLGQLDLDPLITHTLPLARAPEAVELALSGEAGKVYLQP